MDLDRHLPGIAAGDPRAFSAWVAGAELRLRASLARFAGAVDVEALLQETLLRVWQVAPRVVPDGRPDSLLRFAVRVGRNAAVSELRRLGVAPVALQEEDAADVPAIEPDPLLRQLIARCRAKLPKRPALALDARLTDGGAAPDRDLAEALGMSLNTFLQNVTRARKLLAACLEHGGARLEEIA